MATADSDQERQRLRELYSAMSDQELLRIAEDSGGLTSEAQEALDDEIERRDLDEAGYEPGTAGKQQLAFEEMVAIRDFRNLHEALLAKGALDCAGIKCSLTDANMSRVAYSNLVGGIKLCVRERDADAALDLLEQPPPASLEAEASSYQPRCSQCMSVDVVSSGANPGSPLIPADTHKCLACGHEWQD